LNDVHGARLVSGVAYPPNFGDIADAMRRAASHGCSEMSTDLIFFLLGLAAAVVPALVGCARSWVGSQ
jgi:hypothetical protein